MEGLSEWKNLRQTLREMQMWEAERYKAHLKESDRYATHRLYDSVKAVDSNIVFTIENGVDTFEIYLQMEDYWKYVENDTVPHWPPVGALREWVQVRRSSLIQRFANNSKRLPTDKQLEFLVARRISEVGTKGKPDLEMTLSEANKYWKDKIAEAINKDVGDMAVQITRSLMKPIIPMSK